MELVSSTDIGWRTVPLWLTIEIKSACQLCITPERYVELEFFVPKIKDEYEISFDYNPHLNYKITRNAFSPCNSRKKYKKFFFAEPFGSEILSL